MTMQERGKDEPNAPPINTDRADELAADFTPSWASSDDVDEKTAIDAVADKSVLPDAATSAEKTEVMAAITDQPPVDSLPVPAPVVVAKPIEPQPIISAKNKTMIGAAIAPATPPPPQVVEQPAPPELAPELAAQIKREARQQIEPEAFEAPKSFAPVASVKDPFAPVPSTATAKAQSIRPAVISDSDLAPKKSNKGLIFAIVGLGIAGGLGIFLKFALSEDPPKPKEPTQQASTPPVTPPNNDVPPPTAAADPTPPPAATTAAAKTADPPAAVANNAAPTKKDPPAVVAPQPRTHHNNPPAVVAPPPVVQAPKEQPKPQPKPGGGIVHENPF